MSFITNYFSLSPLGNISTAAQNIRSRLNSFSCSPITQIASHGIMSVSMALLTTEVLSEDPLPLDDRQGPLSSITIIKTAALLAMTTANGFVLCRTLLSIYRDHQQTFPVISTTPSPQLYVLLEGLDLTASISGLLASSSFLILSRTGSQNSAAQPFYIVSGVASSFAYAVYVVAIVSITSRNQCPYLTRRTDLQNLFNSVRTVSFFVSSQNELGIISRSSHDNPSFVDDEDDVLWSSPIFQPSSRPQPVLGMNPPLIEVSDEDDACDEIVMTNLS